MRIPAPGSHDAMRQGCRCSPHENQWGKGTPETSGGAWPHFMLDPRCPMHDEGYSWTPAPVEVLELPPTAEEEFEVSEAAYQAERRRAA